MAALQGTFGFGGGASIALSAGVAKTVCRIKAATNQRAKILGYGFFFDGTSNAAQPVEIKIAQITTDGGTYTSVTPQPMEEELTETFQTTVGVNATVEPTTYNAQPLKTITVHPQLGYEYLSPLGQERVLKGGGMLGFVAIAPAGVNIRGYVLIEE
jgi:hypothetical protein